MHRTRTVALLLAITACEGTPNESRLSHRSNPLYGEFSQLFDLNSSGGSNPHEFAASANLMFFVADADTRGYGYSQQLPPPPYGAELWVTDGTLNKTHLVKDLCPGICSSGPEELTAGPGGWVYFRPTGLGADNELRMADHFDIYRVSQYPSGVLDPTNITPGSGGDVWYSGRVGSVWSLYRGRENEWPENFADGKDPKYLIHWNWMTYFNGADATEGRELWVADGANLAYRLAPIPGTPPTTIRPGTASSNPRFPIVYGNALVFIANDGASGNELWKYNPATGVATLVVDLVPGSAGAWDDPDLNPDFTIFENRLYFIAKRPTIDGEEVGSTDGTSAGTSMLDLQPGTAGSNPRELTAAASDLFFVATTSNHGREVWKIQSAGAFPVIAADVQTTFGVGSNPGSLVAWGDSVLFRATDASGDTDLWKADSSGFAKHDLNTSGSSNPTPLGGTWPGYVLLSAETGAPGNFEPWSVDLRGPWPVPGLDGKARVDVYSELATFNGQTVFAGGVSESGNPPWGIEPARWGPDGPLYGPRYIRDVYVGGDSNPAEFTEFSGRLYYSAHWNRPTEGGDLGREIVHSDSALNNAQKVDIYSGSASSDPLELTVGGSRLYFTAVDASGRLVRSLDSTNAVTAIPAPPAGNSADAPAQLAYANGLLFFVADNAAAGLGRQLFVYSQTTGTTPLFERNAGPVGDVYSELVPLSNRLYFVVRNDATMRYELWSTNGGAPVPVVHAGLGSPVRGAKNLRDVNALLWFAADDPASPGVTWLSRIDPASSPFQATQFPSCNDPADFLAGSGAYSSRLYFACTLGASPGRELFYYTNTTGVVLVSDLNATGDSNPRPLKAIGDRLYFAADDGLHGEEMHYVLNGQYVESPSDFDFVKGAVGSSPRDLVEVTLPLLPSFWHFTIQEGTVRTLWGIESL